MINAVSITGGGVKSSPRDALFLLETHAKCVFVCDKGLPAPTVEIHGCERLCAYERWWRE